MVFVSYSHRILIDYNFTKWLSEKKENKSLIITKMLRINQNSKEHKKKNILILEDDFNKLCEDGIIKDRDTILGGVHPTNLPDDLKEKLEQGIKEGIITNTFVRLILGVLATKEKPFQCVLLTTHEGKKQYEEHKSFLEKIPNFSIKCEEESLIIINELFKDYAYERDRTR